MGASLNKLKRYFSKKIVIISFLFLFLSIFFAISHNYFTESGFPLTGDGLGNLGVSWTLRNSILQNGLPGRWDYIGGTSLGEFQPFPGSYFFFGLLALINPDQNIILKIAGLAPIVIAGLSMYLLIKIFTRNAFGAFLACLIYAFNPYFFLESSVYGHINLTQVYMIFPLLLFFLYRALITNNKINLCWAIIVCTDILLIDIQYGVLSMALLVFFVFSLSLLSIIDKKNFPISARKIILYSFSVISVSILLSMFQIVSWFTLKSEIALRGFDAAEIKLYSTPLLAAISLLAELPKIFHFSPNPFHLWYLFAAIIGLYFCRNRFRYFLGFFIVVSIVLAMGDRTPFFTIIHNLSSLFSYFRVPSRFLFILVALICFSVGYINPSKKKWKIFILSLFIFLTLGIINGPPRWQLFQTFNLYGKTNSFNFIEQPVKEDKLLYDWLGNNNLPGRIAFYQLNSGGVVLSMFWSTFHGRRIFDAAVGHNVSKLLADYLNEANRIEDGPTLAKVLGIVNIRYLIPRYKSERLVNGSLGNSFPRINISDTRFVYENRKFLPFLRLVNSGILVIGDNRMKVSRDLLENKLFDPEKMILITAEKPDIDDYDHDTLKRYDYLVIAGNYFKDKNKAENLIDQYRNYGQIIECNDLSKPCDLKLIKFPEVKNGPVMDSNNSPEPNSVYPFVVKKRSRGAWLVLSEPYYRNWRVNIDGKTAKTELAYGVVNAVYVTADKNISGYFFYGMSENQKIAALISLTALAVFIMYFVAIIWLK